MVCLTAGYKYLPPFFSWYSICVCLYTHTLTRRHTHTVGNEVWCYASPYWKDTDLQWENFTPSSWIIITNASLARVAAKLLFADLIISGCRINLKAIQAAQKSVGCYFLCYQVYHILPFQCPRKTLWCAWQQKAPLCISLGFQSACIVLSLCCHILDCAICNVWHLVSYLHACLKTCCHPLIGEQHPVFVWACVSVCVSQLLGLLWVSCLWGIGLPPVSSDCGRRYIQILTWLEYMMWWCEFII